MIKKFGEFIFEGKEHSFANKVVRIAQSLLSEEEQDDQTLYEKIMGWAISYYDTHIDGKIATDADCEGCISAIKPKIVEYREKQKAPKVKGKKKSDDEDDDDE